MRYQSVKEHQRLAIVGRFSETGQGVPVVGRHDVACAVVSAFESTCAGSTHRTLRTDTRAAEGADYLQHLYNRDNPREPAVGRSWFALDVHPSVGGCQPCGPAGDVF